MSDISMMALAVALRPNVCNVERAIDNGGDVNQVYQGKSLLWHAIDRGDAEIVKLLINAGAIYEKISTLKYAIKQKNDEVIKTLIELWGDLNIPYEGVYPLISSIRSGDYLLAKTLKKYGASLSKMTQGAVIHLNNPEIVQAYFEAGGNPNDKHKGFYLLTHAIANGDIPLVKVLKKYNASFDLVLSVDRFNISWSDTRVARAFIEAGGDPNKPYEGIYPLTHAIVNGNDEVVEVLKEASVDIDLVLQNDFLTIKNAMALKDREIERAFNASLLDLDYPYEYLVLGQDNKPETNNYSYYHVMFGVKLLFFGVFITSTLTTNYLIYKRYSEEKRIYDGKHIDDLMKKITAILNMKSENTNSLMKMIRESNNLLKQEGDNFPGVSKALFRELVDNFLKYNEDYTKADKYGEIGKRVIVKTVHAFKDGLENVNKALSMSLKSDSIINPFAIIGCEELFTTETTIVNNAVMNVFYEYSKLAKVSQVSMVGMLGAFFLEYFDGSNGKFTADEV